MGNCSNEEQFEDKRRTKYELDFRSVRTEVDAVVDSARSRDYIQETEGCHLNSCLQRGRDRCGLPKLLFLWSEHAEMHTVLMREE
jgi:hypothetical protein